MMTARCSTDGRISPARGCAGIATVLPRLTSWPLLFEHGTVNAAQLHNALAEPLCQVCVEFIETLRTRSIMSMSMRAMNPVELRQALLRERVGHTPRRGRDNSERIRAWRLRHAMEKTRAAQVVQARSAPPRGEE
jgi:hypothetical protein